MAPSRRAYLLTLAVLLGLSGNAAALPPAGPSAITDLRAEGTGTPGEVRLRWTAPASSIGTRASLAAADCVAVAEAGSPSGVYWLDPDGAGANAPFRAYCDNATDGGG